MFYFIFGIVFNTLSIPRWSNSLNCILIISWTVISGKVVAYGLFVKGLIDEGPVEPKHEPR